MAARSLQRRASGIFWLGDLGPFRLERHIRVVQLRCRRRRRGMVEGVA